MKKQLLIIAVCLLGAFATVQNVDARGKHHRKSQIYQVEQCSKNSSSHKSYYKSSCSRDSGGRSSSGISFSLNNGKFSISIGNTSKCSRKSYNRHDSYSKPLVIFISDGYRIYRPSYSRHAYLQKWSGCHRNWLNIKTYYNFR